MSTTVLYLPRPPSLNGLFANRKKAAGRKGRKRTDAYTNWLDAAGWELIIQKPAPVLGQVRVAMAIEDEGRGDIDNLFKATLDLLVTHRVIEGDSRKYVREVSAKWCGHTRGCRVEVQPA